MAAFPHSVCERHSCACGRDSRPGESSARQFHPPEVRKGTLTGTFRSWFSSISDRRALPGLHIDDGVALGAGLLALPGWLAGRFGVGLCQLDHTGSGQDLVTPAHRGRLGNSERDAATRETT
jgi:hypothetical protein